jgi:hypothetical protein
MRSTLWQFLALALHMLFEHLDLTQFDRFALRNQPAPTIGAPGACTLYLRSNRTSISHSEARPWTYGKRHDASYAHAPLELPERHSPRSASVEARLILDSNSAQKNISSAVEDLEQRSS